MNSRTVIFIVVFAGTTAISAFIALPTWSSLEKGIAYCNDLGMKLLEIRSQSDFDLWNASWRSISSSTYPFWLGLVRNESSPSNFSWLSGGDADWFKWAPGHPIDSNETDRYRCVRYNMERDFFQNVMCNGSYNVACYGSADAGAERTYSRGREEANANSSSLTFFKRNKTPHVDTAWDIDWVSKPVGDVDSCMLACHTLYNCVGAYYRNAWTCMLFLEVTVV